MPFCKGSVGELAGPICESTRRYPGTGLWGLCVRGHQHAATLYLYAQRVRIVAGPYEAEHPRKFVAHEGSSLAEHRAARVTAVSGKRGKRYLKLAAAAAA